jgi:hypothetical protein
MAFRGMSETQLHLNAGDVNNPAICNQGDLDTGVFWDAAAPCISQTVGGVENMRCRGADVAAVVSLTANRNDDSATNAAINFENAGSGFFGLASHVFGATIEGVYGGCGWAHTGGERTLYLIPSSSLSVVDLSTAGDHDTGLAVNVGGVVNTQAMVTGGVERTRWTATTAIIENPALANSTGAVSDTGAVQTTDATQTTVHTLSLADNTTYAVSVTVAGRDTAGTERCSYIRYVQAHRQGGGGATISAITSPFTVESDAGLDCTFTVSSNDLRVSVTGKAGVTINWAARVTSIGAE